MSSQRTVIGRDPISLTGPVQTEQLSRSPSPPPQYDNFGRRVNTREYRYRKRLEDERHKQIEKAMKIIPNYHPPSDYRRPTKTQEKVYVPVNDYPEINFSMITNPLTAHFFANSVVPYCRLSALCIMQRTFPCLFYTNFYTYSAYQLL